MEDGEQSETQNISISFWQDWLCENCPCSEPLSNTERAHQACCCRPCQDERGKYYSNLADRQAMDPRPWSNFYGSEIICPKWDTSICLIMLTNFKNLISPTTRLPEVAEAATSIGILGFLQGKTEAKIGRPVFALNFYGKCFAVAVSVGDISFVFSMNK